MAARVAPEEADAARPPRLSVITALRGDPCPHAASAEVELIAVGPADVPLPPGARHVPCASSSLARRLNRGLREARGEYLLLLDPGYEVPPGTFEACLRSLGEQHGSGVAVLGCRVRGSDGPLAPIAAWPLLGRAIYRNRLFGRALRALRPPPDDVPPGALASGPVTAVRGCFLLFHRSLLAEVGPLDPDFEGGAALLEWQYRVRCRGYGIWFEARACVTATSEAPPCPARERLDRALWVLKLYHHRGYATWFGLRTLDTLCGLLGYPMFDARQRREIRAELALAGRTGTLEAALPLLYAPHFASAWRPLSPRARSAREAPIPCAPRPWSPAELATRVSAGDRCWQMARPLAGEPAGAAGGGLATPVLLLVFNRPDLVERQLAVLREVGVERLFVVADGPRPHCPADAARCRETRELLEGFDGCTVLRRFLPVNLGCHELIPRAVSWFFQQVDFGIILEDDCLAHPDFFRLCTELGARYADTEVMAIAGSNFQRGRHRGEPGASYYFSRYGDMWGWASWRRAWQHYRHGLPGLGGFLRSGALEDIAGSRRMGGLWARRLRQVASEPRWDYHWLYTIWRKGGLCVFPNRNLVSNLGFREDGTTITPMMRGPFSEIPVEALGPLRHPRRIAVDRQADAFATHGRFGLEELLRPAVPETWLAKLHRRLAAGHGLGPPVRRDA